MNKNMKRKHLTTKAATVLLTALLLTATFVSRAQETLTVYDQGTDENEYVPIYAYYTDETVQSQFIMPAADLAAMQWGTITGLTFYAKGETVDLGDAEFEVYMAEGSQTTLPGTALLDWTSLVKVKASAKLTVSDYKMVITLDDPFYYQGNNLLIGVKQTESGEYVEGWLWQGVKTADDVAVGGCESSSTVLHSEKFLPKTTFTYTAGSAPTCLPPSGLKLVGDAAYNQATITWTPGEAGQDAWQVCVNGDETAVIDVTENPYTLTGLVAETSYRVKVRSNCGGGDVSIWSPELTFVTPERFIRPTEVATEEVKPTSATVTWSGKAASYNIRYRKVTETATFTEDFENGLGDWTVIRNGEGATNTDWRTFDATKLGNNGDRTNHSGSYVAMTRSWADTEYDVDNWLISPEVTLGGKLHYWVADDGNYHEYYAIYVSTTTNDVSAFTKVFEPGEATDTWEEITVDLSAFMGQTGYIAFRHMDYDQDYLLIDDVSVSTYVSTDEWTTVSDITSPYQLEGLAPTTMYMVEVQAVYDDGTSAWVGNVLTTEEDNPVPSEIRMGLLADQAAITWKGFGDSYNLQYRTTGSRETLFWEDFENGIARWTTLRQDGGTTDTDWHTVDPIDYFESGDEPHGGQYVGITRSWYNQTAYSVDNWLISPQVTLDGTLSFWTMDDGEYHESIEVYVSTTGNSVGDFTLLFTPVEPTDKWTEVTYDLTSYAGQTGYIALRNKDSDKNYLLIDDIRIYKTLSPAGAWQDMASLTINEATLTGLTTNTAYEFRVQSVKGNVTTDWSETGSFALLTLQDGADNSDLIIDNVGRQSHVTLSGRTLYRDGQWNTLCLPFDVDDCVDDDGLTFTDTPLEGAEVRTLTSATFSSGVLTLNFGDAVTGMRAGVPYIVKWPDGEPIVNPVFENFDINKTLRALTFDNGKVTFRGSYDPVSYTDEDRSVLLLGSENKLYHPHAGATVGAFRAAFSVDLSGGGAVTSTEMRFGDATSIVWEASPLPSPEGKGDWYDLSGRCIDATTAVPGLYIRNGRKIIVK